MEDLDLKRIEAIKELLFNEKVDLTMEDRAEIAQLVQEALKCHTVLKAAIELDIRGVQLLLDMWNMIYQAKLSDMN